MRFQVQQCDNDSTACEDCEDCNDGDYGDCIFTTYRPFFLYAKDEVEVADVGGVEDRVRAALFAARVAESDHGNVMSFEFEAGGDDCLDPYDLKNATIFDVKDDDGRYHYVVTIL